MKVKCEKHPQLIVADIGIRFRDGIAEVKAAKKIEALRRMEEFGFVFEEPPTDTSAEEAAPEQSGDEAGET